ncbi:MAG: pre-peptidase C-terminal domain-containing protein [Polyangiaceae bacterium]
MRATRFASSLFVFASLSGLVACSAGANVADEPVNSDETDSAERWNRANDPAFVDNTFVYEVDKLPALGEIKAPPTPGDYWATYKDSINVRWDGEDSLSPAEKWAKAFNRPTTPDVVSRQYGIKSRNSKECTQESDCSDLKDGSSCAIPRGESKGRCIPTWFGICHGWAPYAFSEPTPVNPVVKNGVTFYPGDLEGIMSLVYGSNLPTKFLSERCNTNDPAVGDDGRVGENACRDMNPGSFHVVATNMLGLRATGFVEDRTYDDEVWNQPVRSYRVTNANPDGKLPEISKADAAALLGIDVKFEEVLARTTLKKNETKSGVYKATTDGELVVHTNGTGDAELYVKKGAVATPENADCKSTGSTAVETCRITLAAGEELHYTVSGFSDTSDVSASIGTKLPAADVKYTFNQDAKRFFHVKMDFRYISESRPARASHIDRVDEFTRTDSYEYILETDEAGRIMGGEWLNESRTLHPDFVWWPSAKPKGTVAGGLISYDEAAALNAESAKKTEGGGDVTPVEAKVLLKDVTLRNLSSEYVTVGVPAGKKLTLKLTGTGNANLYARLGSRPTIFRFDAKSTNAGSDQSIELTAPEGGGSYIVRVHAIAGRPTVTLTSEIK